MNNSLIPQDNEPMPAPRGLTCLRCQHCQPTPETDFSRLLRFAGGRVSLDTEAIVPIRCAKTGRARPAQMWQGCTLAEEGYTSARVRATQGDRLHGFGEVELLFWRALAPRVGLDEQPKLLMATARPAGALKHLRHRHGIRSAVQSPNQVCRASVMARIDKGSSFTPQQAAWVIECREKGRYPRNARGKAGETNAEQEELREALLAGIAERGAPKTWRQVVAHVHYVSPANQKKRERQRKAGAR